ncbi:MAG: type IV pilus assembly protein PilM [Verrucomicrobiota bacterium]
MLNTKSFLAVDFGAGSLKLAEFQVNEAGGLSLINYGIKSLGLEGASQEAAPREAAILKALQELIAEKGIKSKDINVCAPGFHVFSKFVKLPPVDAGKVTQIIQYEAQQNVPFPLEEVVWDYQILGNAAGGELEVLLVAIKSDIVEGLFRVTEAAKLKLAVADVSPAALCNAFRYNYGDLEDCTMLLDIGAKTSNLLFFEKGKVFSRSINLGANAITQDFMQEAKLKFDNAEKIKRDEGFVSLGGAYEEPENEHQAAISKIARQFMTRLHIQVNQTMQFYRGQQGGSAPARLFLSGGASIMPYTAQFFAEKLNVPVEYFNPFRSVQIDSSVNLEELARVAHSLGEVVGLGLRNLAHCPVELNLIPASTRKMQSFNEKKPYLIATVFSLVAVVAAMGFLFQKLAEVKTEELESKVKVPLDRATLQESNFKKAHQDLQDTVKELDQVGQWLSYRYFWPDLLAELRRVMIRTEQVSQQKLKTDVGVWIEQFWSVPPAQPGGDPANGIPGGMVPGMPGAMPGRYMPVGPEGRFVGEGSPPPVLAAPGTDPLQATNEVTTLTLKCRAVNLANVQSDANTTIIYALQNELRSSTNFFDAEKTEVVGTIVPDDATGTFTFDVLISLKHPLKP